MVIYFKQANLLDHSVTSTLVKLALFRKKKWLWNARHCTSGRGHIFFLQMHCTSGSIPKEPNLNRNAVRWEKPPSACIAGGQVYKKRIRLYEHLMLNYYITKQMIKCLAKGHNIVTPSRPSLTIYQLSHGALSMWVCKSLLYVDNVEHVARLPLCQRVVCLSRPNQAWRLR